MRGLRRMFVIVGCLAVLVAGVISRFDLVERLAVFPVGTDTVVTLSVGADAGKKADLVKSLQESLAEARVSAYRIDDSATDHVVYYRFGVISDPPASGLRSRSSRIVPGHELADLPMSGAYALLPPTGPALQAVLQWADTHSVGISVDKDRSGPGTFVVGILRTSLGLSLLSVLLLSAACVTTWYGARIRERALRFVNGQTRSRLEIEDFHACMGRLCAGSAVGGVLALVFGYGTFTWPAFTNYCGLVGAVSTVILGIFVILCLGTSLLLRPGPGVLTREIQTQEPLGRTSLVLRVLALVIASTLVPITVNAYADARATQNRIDDATGMGDIVSVGISAATTEDAVRESANAAAARWVSMLEDRQALTVSYAMDSGFQVPETLKKYSHILLVDAQRFERLKARGLEITAPPVSVVEDINTTIEPWLNPAADPATVSYFEGSGINVPTLGNMSSLTFTEENDRPPAGCPPGGFRRDI